MHPLRRAAGFLLAMLALASADAGARTVYRCVQGGTVSLATAPEPGSKCTAKEIDDNAVSTPNLWGSMGVFSGTLYEREQDGQKVYSTRNLPGSTPYLKFTVQTPPGEPAHPGLGTVAQLQLGQERLPGGEQFRLVHAGAQTFVEQPRYPFRVGRRQALDALGKAHQFFRIERLAAPRRQLSGLLHLVLPF